MREEYYVINDYEIRREVRDGKERTIIDLIKKNGERFPAMTPEGITDEEIKKITKYLDSIFKDNNGTGAGALISILYYIQNI